MSKFGLEAIMEQRRRAAAKDALWFYIWMHYPPTQRDRRGYPQMVYKPSWTIPDYAYPAEFRPLIDVVRDLARFEEYVRRRWPLTDWSRYPRMAWVPREDIYTRIRMAQMDCEVNAIRPRFIYMRPSAFWLLDNLHPERIVRPWMIGKAGPDTVAGMEILVDYTHKLPDWADFMICSEREENNIENRI